MNEIQKDYISLSNNQRKINNAEFSENKPRNKNFNLDFFPNQDSLIKQINQSGRLNTHTYVITPKILKHGPYSPRNQNNSKNIKRKSKENLDVNIISLLEERIHESEKFRNYDLINYTEEIPYPTQTDVNLISPEKHKKIQNNKYNLKKSKSKEKEKHQIEVQNKFKKEKEKENYNHIIVNNDNNINANNINSNNNKNNNNNNKEKRDLIISENNSNEKITKKSTYKLDSKKILQRKTQEDQKKLLL